jgi:hypothetical protein
LALAIFIHDAEITALFHHEPFLRYGGKTAPVACSSEAFATPTATSWLRAMKKDHPNYGRQGVRTQDDLDTAAALGGGTPSPSLRYHLPNDRCSHSTFSAYTILECMGAAICEDRVVGERDTTLLDKNYELDLISWYQVFGPKIKADDESLSSSSPASDPQCLLVLWHWTFMSKCVDLNRLELAVGKRGPAKAEACMDYLREWYFSADCKRCLLHALYLQKLVEDMSMLRRPTAVHVPRCLFSAAICWAAYFLAASVANNASRNEAPAASRPASPLFATNTDHFPEFRMLGDVESFSQQQQLLSEINGGFRKGNLTLVKGNTLCTLADMLRQFGHWDIARRFSQILGPLIHGGVDQSLLSF